MVEQPDYVRNFDRPPHTEIKHIKNGWYLYERFSEYDPITKRSRKISGRLLGTFKPTGFVPSEYAKRKAEEQREKSSNEQDKLPNDSDTQENSQREESSYQYSDDDHAKRKETAKEQRQTGGIYTAAAGDASACMTVQSGAVNFLYNITGQIRKLLKKYFPENWIVIYTIAIIRAIHSKKARFCRIQEQYYESLLSHIYPNLILDKTSLSGFLVFLGLNRESITLFMKELSQDTKEYVLVDGTRIISYSNQMNTAQLGYDSKNRHKKQINLMYLVARDSWGIGIPMYYKQYSGCTPDVSAINDIITEAGDSFKDIVIVGDKGTANEKVCEQIVNAGINYVFALKRGSREVLEYITNARMNFGPMFFYNGRSLAFLKIPKGDYNVFVYLDYCLLSDELNTLNSGKSQKITSGEKHLIKVINQQTSILSKAQKVAEKKAAELEKAQNRVNELATIASAAEEAAKEAEMSYLQEHLVLLQTEWKASMAKTEKQKTEFARKIEKKELQVEDAREYFEKKRAISDKRSATLNKAQQALDKCTERLQDAKNALTNAEESLALSQRHLAYLQSNGEYSASEFFDLQDTNNLEVGTFSLITSLTNLSGLEIYYIYKQRPIIEQFFKTYTDTLGFDSSYMRSPTSEEGWLFLNHISAYMSSLVYEKLASLGLKSKISYVSLMNTLSSIRVTKINGKYVLEPISRKVKSLCSHLGFDPAQIVVLDEADETIF